MDLVGGISGINSLDLPNQDAIAIDALTLEQYHIICYWNLSRHQNLYCPASASVNLNTVIALPWGDQLEDSIEIAFLPNEEAYLGDWASMEGATAVMEGGWTRYNDFILAA
jgi:hypothetical protein